MPPDFKDPEKVRAVGDAISGIADDPIHILKQAGIDIEPELEEFLQFLAEIGGEKVEPEGQINVARVPKPSGELAEAKLEVLSILHGLEFAGFSEEAKQKAIERLSARIGEVSAEKLTPENLQKLGLCAFAVEMIKSGNFERLGEIERI
ncbi:hypothetical protein [Thermococcus thioreducens]|uniref:Uncharacterized protein n=1 Tax=Thermococcus thioreducens TaxID=277988 RepID=A0A0Q2QQC7_9EURY|nr:hypothetical protein [Thermococcus thioreducens]ASJ11821.1 hypothetical protein A3L14_02460 [Thermococcus thioreducens]KQH82157.1 hypothetical protein AMR53_07400 [Thermococcus thioreducens]